MSISFTNILYPTDFSELSIIALAYTRHLASKFNSQLHCLHVADEAYQYWSGMGPESIPIGPPPDEVLEFHSAQMERFKQDHLSGFDQAPITQVVMGRPFTEIITYARDQNIDLIVMATHGRGGLAHVLLGSTTEKVVRKASCAVFTVRAGDVQSELP